MRHLWKAFLGSHDKCDPCLCNESPCTLAAGPPPSSTLTYGKIGRIDTAVRIPIRHPRITSDTVAHDKLRIQEKTSEPHYWVCPVYNCIL